MGFSPWGLVVAAVMLAPSLLLWAWPPRTPLPTPPIPAPLVWMERSGQALCIVVATLVPAGAMAPGWIPLLAISTAAYYALWARYLRGGRTSVLLFAPWWIIPVPLALLPVAAFVSAAGWLSNPWLAVSAVILAAGHIPASAYRARAALSRP